MKYIALLIAIKNGCSYCKHEVNTPRNKTLTIKLPKKHGDCLLGLFVHSLEINHQSRYSTRIQQKISISVMKIFTQFPIKTCIGVHFQYPFSFAMFSFSWEFCKLFQNICNLKHLRTTASVGFPWNWKPTMLKPIRYF